MRIVIPGQPLAKTRHRSFIRNGHIATYDNQTAEKLAYQQLLAIKCIAENHEPKEIPVKVDLIFQLDCFKGASKLESNLRQWSGQVALKNCSAVKRIDLDNICKFCLDCGNGILWPDDRFIVQLSSRKLYSKTPCTIITVNPINEATMSAEHEKVFKLFSPQDLEVMSADIERIFMAVPPHKLDDTGIYESQLAAAAELLIDFADEWCDKLKKIKRKS